MLQDIESEYNENPGVLRMRFQENAENLFEAMQLLQGQLGNSCG